MSEHLPLITIALTPRFKKDLKELAKRYPSIRQDIEPLINQLLVTVLLKMRSHDMKVFNL